MSKTIIVSNRLPISIVRSDEGISYKPSSGGLATGLGSVYKKGNNIWLGWPGIDVDSEEEQEQVVKDLTKENMRPVFLTQDDIKLYYEGFSNSTIWPLFHYHTQFTEYDDNTYDAYVKVNRKFCNEILKYAEDGDVIWVHDYQLMLLPEMIREELPNASIGYFHHIPFPSYEIFRALPWRKRLLRGLLGADLIGVHTFDDMRHFLSAVSRLLGHDHEMGHLKYNDRLVNIDAIPIGIDYEKFSQTALSKDTHKEIKSFYGSLSSQQLILSIDRLDYSKGIPQRLYALDRFFEKYSEFQGKVSLILLVVPSRDKVESYMHLKEEIELLVGRINGKYSKLDWTPIHFFYRSLPFNKLSALYVMSDVALVTPLRDGMNMVCKEYIASKLDKTGVLILSEMAGAVKELSEAIIINPNDINKIVESLYAALNMPEDEQIRRNTEMQAKLKRYDIHNWVKVFMDQLNKTKEAQKSLMAKQITIASEKLFCDDYKKASKRLIFLDYDGTLIPFHSSPSAAVPDKELENILQKLNDDENNRVIIISGRDRKFIQKTFAKYSNFEFVAEHGVWVKEKDSEWVMIDDLEQSWKEDVLPILELYVARTPGSMIEHKDFSLVWHYRKADVEFGELRARELVSNLQYLTSNMDVSILEGNKVIEVKNSGVNKGRAAVKWLAKDKWDFVFAAGDDWTDEDTFKVMPEDAFSIKVGLGASEARFNVRSVQQVRRILTSCVD